ncbi:hypothetical protein [Acidiphilium sp. MT5]
MHMPKAGGTALIREIERSLRPLRWAGGIDRTLTGNFEAFDTMDIDLRAGVFRDETEIPANVDFLAGHFGWGMLRAWNPEAKLMTVLREPRSRLLSYWFYLGNYSDHVLSLYGDYGERLELARKHFGDYISIPEIACQTDNLMTRMLVWPHPACQATEFISPEMDETLLMIALERLNQFDFVGMIEDLRLRDRLFLWLGSTYKHSRWASLEKFINRGHKINKNEASIPKQGLRKTLAVELNEETIRRLESSSRLDKILWMTIARQLFDDKDPNTIADQEFSKSIKKFDTLIERAK